MKTSSEILSLFSTSYVEAREKFLSACEAAGVEVVHRVNPQKGVSGEELAADVARLGARDARKVMLLSSAAHGVEGFAGSAIQTGLLLERESLALPDDVAVVLVHALNPHGMSWSRRETEDGVDVTRNLSHHKYDPMPNPDYELLRDLLVPKQLSKQVLAEVVGKAAELSAKRPPDWLTRVLRIGQYTHPEGLTYHGLEPCWSTRVWMQAAAEHTSSADRVMVIDLHTGYGEYGELLTQNPSYRHTSPAFALLEKWLGEEPAGYSADGSIIEHRIETFESIHDQCRRDAQVAAMYFEFGTVSMEEYAVAWIANNWLYHHGDRQSEEARRARAAFASLFYVPEDAWKTRVWSEGFGKLRQLLGALAAPMS